MLEDAVRAAPENRINNKQNLAGAHALLAMAHLRAGAPAPAFTHYDAWLMQAEAILAELWEMSSVQLQAATLHETFENHDAARAIRARLADEARLPRASGTKPRRKSQVRSQ